MVTLISRVLKILNAVLSFVYSTVNRVVGVEGCGKQYYTGMNRSFNGSGLVKVWMWKTVLHWYGQIV
jgi:hypothetical protein